MSKSDLIEDLMEVIFLEFARSVIHLCIKIIKKKGCTGYRIGCNENSHKKTQGKHQKNSIELFFLDIKGVLKK